MRINSAPARTIGALLVGEIAQIHRFPVKSMRGETVAAASLGWHGLEGDRRLALRRLVDGGGFPWLTAGRFPELMRFTPERVDGADVDALPTHVRTPDGRMLPILGEDLAAEVGRSFGAPVEMMQLSQGIFDDAAISVIAVETIEEIGRLAGMAADARRFRPNVVVRATRGVAFEEDAWVGGVLTFGDADDAPAVTVTKRDVRCAMVNLDPDGGPPSPAVLKAVVRANQNNAGVYGAVARVGRLEVGQIVRLWPTPLPG